MQKSERLESARGSEADWYTMLFVFHIVSWNFWTNSGLSIFSIEKFNLCVVQHWLHWMRDFLTNNLYNQAYNFSLFLLKAIMYIYFVFYITMQLIIFFYWFLASLLIFPENHVSCSHLVLPLLVCFFIWYFPVACCGLLFGQPIKVLNSLVWLITGSTEFSTVLTVQYSGI